MLKLQNEEKTKQIRKIQSEKDELEMQKNRLEKALLELHTLLKKDFNNNNNNNNNNSNNKTIEQLQSRIAQLEDENTDLKQIITTTHSNSKNYEFG